VASDSVSTAAATSPEASESSDPCKQKSPWGRYYCCGKASELVGLSCVDPNAPADCIPAGRSIDARVAQSYCCEGTRSIDTSIETHERFEEYPRGCGPSLLPPNAKTCSACGNGICDTPVENRCNCEVDCGPPIAFDAAVPPAPEDTVSPSNTVSPDE
jgi:hypothetical protein